MSTPNIGLSALKNQYNAHLILNTNSNRIDALLMGRIIDRDLTADPASPADGDVYLVAASPTGLWTGQAGKIAAYYSGWTFATPREGWSFWIADEDCWVIYDGTNWIKEHGYFLLTDGSGTITIDCNNGDVQKVVLSGTGRTVAAPQHPRDGMRLTLIVQQPGAGSKTITTWNSVFKWTAGTAPTITSTANKTDAIEWVYVASDSAWYNTTVKQNM